MYDNILIDGRNIVYRAVAAARRSDDGTHPTTIFIRMMDKWRRIFKPTKWRVFWDVPKTRLWRKDLYEEYKGGRPNYDPEFRQMISDCQRLCAMLFYNMSVTQYIREHHEADDLIYAFVVSHQDERNLVVSSDGDMPQIPFHHKCDLHSPGKKPDIIPVPDYDPVIVKALSGDKSDNINNYRLVAEKTAKKIIDKGLDEFLDLKGRELFDLNIQLIDLGKNPGLQENIDYVNSVPDNTRFDMKAMTDIVVKNSISGLYSDLISRVKPFKSN